MKCLYTCPPKQCSVVIMPGTGELAILAQQLESIAAALELNDAARSLLAKKPETALQSKLQRRLMRIKATRCKVTEVAAILTGLAAQ